MLMLMPLDDDKGKSSSSSLLISPSAGLAAGNIDELLG